MQIVELTVAEQRVRAKVADTARERYAGMQWLCPAQVKAYPILFLMQQPEPAGFHMNNVFAALDIAFLDRSGSVIAIEHMPLGGGADSPAAVAAVLEAAHGSFEHWGLKVGDQVALPGRR